MRLAMAPRPDREKILRQLEPEQLDALHYDWTFWARPNQLPPAGNWRVWMLLAGRGFGKTRTGAEFIRARVDAGCRHVALVAPTAADARDVMVRGESGLLSIYPPSEAPIYHPSIRRLTWPNGAEALLFSAEEPERFRGPQHDVAWCDEVAAWRYPEALDMLLLGLRLGDDPRIVITTTPRPVKLIRELLIDPTAVVTRGSSYENRINLAQAFFDQIIRKYEGTRLGRQEIDAELLDDVPGALWTRALIEAARPPMGFLQPEMIRVVVAIDPAATSGEDADETGIIVAGKDAQGRGYVLADLSGHYTPTEWARTAIAAYRSHGADRVVAEVNNGGEMVEATLRMIDYNVSYTAVRATRGKAVRAEPVSALYEQGRIRHMAALPKLEDQMCQFTSDLDRSPGQSPDRVDALVWAFTDLLVEPMESQGMYDLYRRQAEALEAKKAAAPTGRPEPSYAIGSTEWAAQQAEKESAP